LILTQRQILQSLINFCLQTFILLLKKIVKKISLSLCLYNKYLSVFEYLKRINLLAIDNFSSCKTIAI